MQGNVSACVMCLGVGCEGVRIEHVYLLVALSGCAWSVKSICEWVRETVCTWSVSVWEGHGVPPLCIPQRPRCGP